MFNSSNLNAQIFNWAKALLTPTPESCYEIESDAYGNTYSTGSFRGTTDFDPGPGVYNLTSIGTDMFILKLDPAGNFVWAKSIGGNLTGTNAAGRGITLDAFNNVYIFGYATYNSVVDYDPGPGVYTLTDGTMPLINWIPQEILFGPGIFLTHTMALAVV
ncbi:MAG: hypothetical protein IPP32_08410 [Bacteroidetes bacterium]|nr:hypothetical protein [Bacteroidota bacterium]